MGFITPHYHHDRSLSPPPAKRSRADADGNANAGALSGARRDLDPTSCSSSDDVRSLSPASRASSLSSSSSSRSPDFSAARHRLPPLPTGPPRFDDRPIIRLPPLRIGAAPPISSLRDQPPPTVTSTEQTYTSTPPRLLSPVSSPPSRDEDADRELARVEGNCTYMAPSQPVSPVEIRCNLPPPDRRRSPSSSPPTHSLPPARDLFGPTGAQHMRSSPTDPMPNARASSVPGSQQSQQTANQIRNANRVDTQTSLAYRHDANLIYIAPNGSPPQIPRAAMEKVVEKTFKCNLCPKSFTRNYDLTRHRSSHQDARLHVCGHCGRSFNRRDALSRHNLIRGCAGQSSHPAGSSGPSGPPRVGPQPSSSWSPYQHQHVQVVQGQAQVVHMQTAPLQSDYRGPTFEAIRV